MAKRTRKILSTLSAYLKGTKMSYLQQGDVLFHPVTIPNETQLTRELSPVVQHGEHTGHKHQIWDHGMEVGFFRETEMPQVHEVNWKLFRNPSTGDRYLKVIDKPVDLKHEEHKTISIPPGEYKIGIVREYDHFKEESREVVD